MTSDDEYVRRTSFETGSIDDWSVAEERVALLAGTVVYLVGDDQDEIELDEPGEQVALNDKLFVVTDGRVEAYAVSGTRLWSADVDDVDGLAAPAKTDLVVVLTAAEQLVGLDAATGHERFVHDRPDADVAATPEMVCAEGSLVVAAWSFLSVLSPEGESQLRTTLDGAIHGVGVVEDTVVCVMKDDRLIGIDAASGDERWQHDWDVDLIDPYGRAELLVRTADGIRAITATGEWTDPGLDDGVPVAAASGEPVCVLVDSLVNVYGTATPGDAAVETTLRADAVEPSGGTVPVEVENVGETMTAATVAVTASGATVPSTPERLTLEPGESQHVRVRLADVEAESIDLTVRIDGDRVGGETLEVAGGLHALDVAAAPATVNEDGWQIEIVVENPSDVPVSGLAMSPGGAERDVLGPGERWVSTVPLPDDSAVVVATGDAERHVDVSVPEDPFDVDIRVDDGLVMVEVSNETRASVSDVVTMSSSAFARELELTFEGPQGSRLVAAVPPVAAGDATVSVDSQLLSRSETVSIPREAVVGRDDPVADRPVRDAHGARLSEGEAGGASASDDAGEELEIERRFEPEDVSLGGLQFEHVTVTNTDDAPTEATVAAPDCPAVTSAVRPDETRTFVRAHTYTESSVEVPTVSVDSQGGRRTTPPVQPDVETPDWYCLASVTTTVDGPQLHLEFVNRSRTRVSVSNLSLRSASFERPSGAFEVPPRSTEARTFSLADEPADGRHELLTFDAGADVASSTEHQTLVHVPDHDRHGLAHVGIAVDDETVLNENGGTVVLRVTNDGPSPVEEFSMTATGEQVKTILYDGLEQASLAPGESLSHYIDVGDAADGLDVSVELGDASGATEIVQITANGPDEATVSFDRPSRTDLGVTDVSVPARISTPFEIENPE